MTSPPCRTARPGRRPGRRPRPRHRLLHRRARPGRARAAGRVRHLRAPRLGLDAAVQRGPHPRHHPGDLRVPRGAGHRRPAVHRPRHPRPVRAGLGDARWRCWPPTTSRCWSTPPTATRRRRPVSHAILRGQPGRTTSGLADGIVVTPSHNPPRDGGFKYNPPHGGPADTDATGWIAGPGQRAARAPGSSGVRRVPLDQARAAARARTTSSAPTSTTCRPSLDLDAIRDAGVRIGADPLGGASVDYWGAIAERHRLDLTVVNPLVDPTWRFMTLDWDGKIRMDCSSPSAMASLIGRKRRVPDRHRQRRRRRPARHRHPRRRPDEPQPLPRRRDRLPVQPPRRTGRPTPRSARRWCPPR